MTDRDYSRVYRFLDSCGYELEDRIFRECLRFIDPDEFMRIAESCSISWMQVSDEDIDEILVELLNSVEEESIYESDSPPAKFLLSEIGGAPMHFLANIVDMLFADPLILMEAVGRDGEVRDVLLRVASKMRSEDTLVRRVIPGAVERYAAWLEEHAGDGDVLNAVWGLAEDRDLTPLRYR